jgi:hypothetical protein
MYIYGKFSYIKQVNEQLSEKWVMLEKEVVL